MRMDGASMTRQSIQLANRIGLTVKETADALGVSERHIRELLPEIPHTRLGNRIVIPIQPLNDWLRKRAESEKQNCVDVAENILNELSFDQRKK